MFSTKIVEDCRRSATVTTATAPLAGAPWPSENRRSYIKYQTTLLPDYKISLLGVSLQLCPAIAAPPSKSEDTRVVLCTRGNRRLPRPTSSIQISWTYARHKGCCQKCKQLHCQTKHISRTEQCTVVGPETVRLVEISSDSPEQLDGNQKRNDGILNNACVLRTRGHRRGQIEMLADGDKLQSPDQIWRKVEVCH